MYSNFMFLDRLLLSNQAKIHTHTHTDAHTHTDSDEYSIVAFCKNATITSKGGHRPTASSSSGPIPMTSVTGHSSQGQTHSRLSQCENRPPFKSHQPITTSRDLDADLRVVGISDSGHACTVHNTQLP